MEAYAKQIALEDITNEYISDNKRQSDTGDRWLLHEREAWLSDKDVLVWYYVVDCMGRPRHQGKLLGHPLGIS